MNPGESLADSLIPGVWVGAVVGWTPRGAWGYPGGVDFTLAWGLQQEMGEWFVCWMGVMEAGGRI